MPTPAEVIHKYNPFAFWRLDEVAGSTVVVDSGIRQRYNGAPVGSPQLGQPGLVPGSLRSVKTSDLNYVSIPHHADFDAITNALSVGMWVTHDEGLTPYAPVLYYKFDEATGTVVTNSGSQGATLNGAFGGAPANWGQLGAVPGRTGSSVRFISPSPPTQSVVVPDHANMRLNGGAFTLAFWYRSGGVSVGQQQSIIAKGDWNTADGYMLSIDAFSLLSFERNNVITTYQITGLDTANVFTHIAVVYNGSSIKWYINGVLRETDAISAYPTNAGTTPAVIAAGGIDPLQGWLDDFAIYNVAVADAFIAEMALGFTPNTTPTSTFGGMTKGADFDQHWSIGWHSWSQGWLFKLYVGGAGTNAENSGSFVTRGQRYFVVGTWDGITMRLYIDGVQVDTTPRTGPIDTSAGAVRIGIQPPADSGATYWHGNFDNVFVYNVALTPEQVAELATADDPSVFAICPVVPERSRERIVYVRPDVTGTKKYTLHAPPSRTVLSEEGFGTPPLQYVTDRAPFQHGENVRSFYLQPRQVQLVVLQNFRNRPDYWAGRAELLAMLRPNALQAFGQAAALDSDRQGKLLCYLSGGAKRQLDVVLESGPGFAPPQGGWREWSFTEVLRFIAYNPVWYDPVQQTTTLASIGQSQLVFPITFPITFSSTGFSSGSAGILYRGDWPEHPKIFVYGPIISPVVTNTATGKMLALLTTIPASHYAEFNLQRKTVVRSDGVNLVGALSSDSDLTTWALEPDPIAPGGLNAVTVDGSGTTGATLPPVIQWYNRYIGI